MEHSVFSFADVSAVISHPSVGQFTITGKGVGSITVSNSNDETQHDTAADGSVMVSKIDTENGTVAIALQQTSAAHRWMKKWHAFLKVSPASEWTKTSITIRNPAIGETITCTGVSPQKKADRAFHQAGQQVTWNLMATSIKDN